MFILIIILCVGQREEEFKREKERLVQQHEMEKR